MGLFLYLKKFLVMHLKINNETSRLRAVVLGTAKSNGGPPKLNEAYDPKSIEHIKAGTYPQEEDMVREMEAVAAVLKKYEVEVFRPQVIENYNQIFTRDIAFVIEYFKELTDVNIRAKLYAETQNQLESDMSPFGFVDNGVDDPYETSEYGQVWTTVDIPRFDDD